MIKPILILTLSLPALSPADEIRDIGCNAAANMVKVGFEVKAQFKTQEDFFQAVLNLTPLKRQSVTIGYLAESKEQAFTEAYGNCLNYKEGKQI